MPATCPAPRPDVSATLSERSAAVVRSSADDERLRRISMIGYSPDEKRMVNDDPSCNPILAGSV